MSPEPFRLRAAKKFLSKILEVKGRDKLFSLVKFSIVIQYFALQIIYPLFLKGEYDYVNLLVQTMKKKRSKTTRVRSLRMWLPPRLFLNYHSVCRRKRKRRRVTLIQKVLFNTEMKRMKMRAIIVRTGKAKEKMILSIKLLAGVSRCKMTGNSHPLPSSHLAH